MKTPAILTIAAVLAASYSTGHAQIPRACADEASLSALTCCPTTSDGVCGADANRGQCVDLQIPGHSNSSTDVRNQWPHYYTRVCHCSGNFSGYDCSRCKFGYYGPDCSQYQVLPRQSVAEFAGEDWAEYNRILGLTRTYDSGYVAVLEETYPGNTSLRTANMTLYGMFIWLHHYAAKDSQVPAMPAPLDYAHTAPGFNTWHRLLSLWLEWEIQGMLQAMSDPDYHTFRLPFWDWRQEFQRSTTGLSADDLFVTSRMGAVRNESGRAVVYGDLYGDGWETMCWRRLAQICDPNETTGLLQRCPFGTNPCSTDNPDWPTAADVLTALSIDDYDFPPYNINTVRGYRSYVDFLTGVLSHEECRNDRLCRCVPSADPTCSNETEFTLRAGMHLAGHIIVGQGDFNFFLNNDISKIGTFEDIAASPNDPFFILHHNMVDCVLVEWLRRHPGTEYPQNVTTPGHACDGYLIPFFPLYTNVEIFAPPEELGYTCNIPGLPGGAQATSATFTSILLLGALAIAVIHYMSIEV